MSSQRSPKKMGANPKPVRVRRTAASAAAGQTMVKPKRMRAPRAPSARFPGASTSAGLMLVQPARSTGQQTTTRVVRRRELVQQVVGTSAFTAVAYPVNAGLAQMFAWLSSEARRYEKYRFRRLAFEYVNSVSMNDATNAGGNVVFAFDADVLDSAPATLQGMMQNEDALLFSPYDKSRLVIDATILARRGWLYTRAGGVPSGADAKTYDLGSFILAQSGCSTNGLGNLFVDYEVELDIPQEVVNPAQKISGSAGLTASALFGSNAAYTGDGLWTLTSSSTLTCAVAGEYIFQSNIDGTTLVATNGGSSVGGTATSTEILATTDGSSASYAFSVRAQVGQTVAPAINSAAAVSAASWRIAPWRYSLA